MPILLPRKMKGLTVGIRDTLKVNYYQIHISCIKYTGRTLYLESIFSMRVI